MPFQKIYSHLVIIFVAIHICLSVQIAAGNGHFTKSVNHLCPIALGLSSTATVLTVFALGCKCMRKCLSSRLLLVIFIIVSLLEIGAMVVFVIAHTWEGIRHNEKQLFLSLLLTTVVACLVAIALCPLVFIYPPEGVNAKSKKSQTSQK